MLMQAGKIMNNVISMFGNRCNFSKIHKLIIKNLIRKEIFVPDVRTISNANL